MAKKNTKKKKQDSTKDSKHPTKPNTEPGGLQNLSEEDLKKFMGCGG